ncbi:hypothetical protein B9N43_00415 [Denitratisoma sp. DHT3]|uniref:hypothetical protein n=1 Tax=Denitratisoma sp. DHT3 TaxID=1981880 RepID=UPI0011984849|nr:hypothetical protein [Denitratisoma sp. DHT3]QDX82773.1 hypothetical protein B9N43_00415 [Denitratisoma sp. DHT3]
MDESRRNSPPTCAGCIHFYITYDPAFPYGCRIMGFKSRRHPHYEVKEATGTTCMARKMAPRQAPENQAR